jgi:proteasome assembly chaperone (PAC2) family protein
MTIAEFECSNEIENLENTTLVLPGPGSIGFLSSLSVDLMINTLKCERVAMIYSPYVDHIIGKGVFDDDEKLHTAIELYKVGDYSVLQLRLGTFNTDLLMLWDMACHLQSLSVTG